jgi:hypothetical protein
VWIRAPRAGFEPAAYSLGARRSIRAATSFPPVNPCKSARSRGDTRSRDGPRATGCCSHLVPTSEASGATALYLRAPGRHRKAPKPARVPHVLGVSAAERLTAIGKASCAAGCRLPTYSLRLPVRCLEPGADSLQGPRRAGNRVGAPDAADGMSGRASVRAGACRRAAADRGPSRCRPRRQRRPRTTAGSGCSG